MSIINYFKKREIALSDETLAAVEQTNKCILPKAYKGFIKNNQLEPQLSDDETFELFISDKGFEEKILFAEFVSVDFLSTYDRFTFADNLVSFILIGFGSGNTGYYLFVEKTNDFGKVFYFDFDIYQRENRFCVANNFEEFMEKLKVVKAQF